MAAPAVLSAWSTADDMQGMLQTLHLFSNARAIDLCRSKVGVAFDDKDEARKVRSGKYSLVDLDSFSSLPVSPGAMKPNPKPK